jgi:membrane protein
MRQRVFSRGFGEKLVRKIKNDNISNGAAALAFYWMLALFPAAIFLLTLLPFLPIERLDEAIMNLLRQAMPEQAADLFAGTVTAVATQRKAGLLSFGLLFTAWSASSGMYALMEQLDETYDVVERRSFVKARGTALLLTLAAVVLVVGAVALVVFGGRLEGFLSANLGWGNVIVSVFAVLRWALIAFSLMLALAFVYAYGPDVERRFHLFSPGTIFGTVALAVASLGFKLYVSSFGSYDKTYGSLGAVIALLMWLFVTGLVVLVGSEIDSLTVRHGDQPS